MRKCSVCGADGLVEIDRLLVTREKSDVEIAATFGLSADAVRRHRQNHLPRTLAAAKDDPQRPYDLAADLDQVIAQAVEFLKQADPKSAGGLLRTWVEAAKVKGQAKGVLSQGGVTVNVQIAQVKQEYNDLRKLLVVEFMDWLRQRDEAVAQDAARWLIEKQVPDVRSS